MPQDPAPPDPVAMLDDVIGALERQRAEALPVLSRAKGVDAERLFKAVKVLDEKLAEARAKRGELVHRLERAARLAEITQAVRTIRAELDAGNVDGERREELRQRGAALQQEGAALLAESKKARDAGG